jgi:glycosyltransferase involved in cell wall biosynthesis
MLPTSGRLRQEMPRSAAVQPRLNVMHVVPSLEPGGTERLVIEISKTLFADAQPIVCCLDNQGAWASELVALGVPVIALHRSPGFRPEVGFAIGRVAATHGIDVLHCHHYSPFVYGQIAALARRGLSVVFTEHGRASDDGPSLKRRLVNPLLGRLPATICAVSHDLRRHMIAEGLPADRVQVVHNGIDPGSRPAPIAKSSARLALGIPQDAFVVGAAGRLDPVKNLPMLIKAAEVLSAIQPRLRIVIVGDGPARPALEQMIDTLGLTRVVVLTGYRSDVRQLLPAFDVYANTSVHEGVSLTILEAMAAALPVVATNVGGTPEVVDEKTGLLVPSHGVLQLARALQSMAHAPPKRRALGEAGRRRVEQHFSLGAMAQAYLDAYRHALKG